MAKLSVFISLTTATYWCRRYKVNAFLCCMDTNTANLATHTS